MTIKINGQEKLFGSAPNLETIVKQEMNGHEPKGIAIAVNGIIVHKQNWNSTLVKQGDNIEIVHAVQGG